MQTFKVSRSKNRPQWARDLRSRVVSLWEEARREHWTHARILAERTARIYDSAHWRQLTQSERAEVNAYFHACSDMAWRRDLVWRLGSSSGPLPEEAQGVWGEDSPLSTLCRIKGALYGAHFWRGTDSAFNDYNATN